MAIMFNFMIRALRVLIILLPLSAFPAAAASLTDISISNGRTHILVDLRIAGAFTLPIQKAVASGVPTSFSFFLTLSETRGFWPDRTLAETTLVHTIKYDALKRRFSVSRSWEDAGYAAIDTFEDAQKLMTEVQRYPLIALDNLEKGKTYRVRIKAKLSKMTLPFYLHHVLRLASKWDFETEWSSIDFDY